MSGDVIKRVSIFSVAIILVLMFVVSVSAGTKPIGESCSANTECLSNVCTNLACADRACTEADWTYSLSTCPANGGSQTKTWTKTGVCSGGVDHTGQISMITCNPPQTEVTACDCNSCGSC